jgi:Xaa-Pro aminopeptidase
MVGQAAREVGLVEGTAYLDPTMWARFTTDLRSSLPETAFALAGDILEPLRARKDDAELQALRRAGEIADEVAEGVRALGSEAVGWTEAELAAHIEDRLTEAGGEELSFPVIVGSGPNGARPHHTHGDRIIEAGDPVVLDFGARVDHYPSDQTRTLVFGGSPPSDFREAFQAVRDAQAAAIEAIEPGVPTGAVDAAAREVIAECGFGDRFIHRTGHGVGLSVHEGPYIVDGGERPLEEGMVFSVEPGVYIEDAFGIRIEDLVVVTEDGCERLNQSARGWRTGTD